MAIQSSNGKGFEYSCLMAFKDYLESQDNIVEIDEASGVPIAKIDYLNLSSESKTKMDRAANAAIKVISRLEPRLIYSNSDRLYLTIQPDKAGIVGDVRDILAIRKENDWEIGISCKHNHSAVKHPRLSKVLDFGHAWLDIPCSDEYFQEITPIFDRLAKLKLGQIEWKNIPNKDNEVYIPILNAFMKELKRLESENNEIVPQRFLSYLVGRHDFYKVVSKPSKEVTEISAFNIYGSLNKNAGRMKPQTQIPKLKMPTKFYDISYKPKSKNTIIATCDNGWAVSMRIHSAATLVESSLKFDINLIGIPPILYRHHEPW